MSGFAVQIDTRDGSTHHMFGSGPDACAEAVAMRDGWQDQHPDGYYTIIVHGEETKVFVRDIADVRLVEGGR